MRPNRYDRMGAFQRWIGSAPDELARLVMLWISEAQRWRDEEPDQSQDDFAAEFADGMRCELATHRCHYVWVREWSDRYFDRWWRRRPLMAFLPALTIGDADTLGGLRS